VVAFLNYKNTHHQTSDTDEIFKWCTNIIRHQQTPLEVSTALGALQVLLRKDHLRNSFYEADGLETLGGIIKKYTSSNSTAAFQILYQSTYALWLMSYNSNIAEKFGDAQIIQRLADLIRTSVKEKVIRMAVACLRNSIEKGNNNQHMIEFNVLKEIDKLVQKKWADEDIVADLELIQQSLQKNMVQLSSFTMYKQELMSGELEWSPVHKSEKFWRENYKNFEENNNKPLATLVTLLGRPESKPLVLAVACYDIGEFVRFHPQGRMLLQNLGAKVAIMNLMNHEDPNVQKQALLCLQKMMVHNWEYLSR
jgi:V-type H+-transporting ATPase subunit H